MQPILREYRPGDLAGLFALDQQCFPSGIAYSRDELQYFLRAKDSFTRIAESPDAELLGFLIAQHYRARPSIQARIITIDVAPAARGTGVATQLMHAAEDEFRRRKISTIRLEVSVENLAAQRFYRKLGYTETGRIERYYLDRIAALTMQKAL